MAKQPAQQPKSDYVNAVTINVRHLITDLNGAQLPVDPEQPDGEKMVLGHILIRTALQPPPPGGKAYTAKQQMLRYETAATANAALQPDGSGAVILAEPVVRELCEEVARLFPPAVAGPVIKEMLEAIDRGDDQS